MAIHHLSLSNFRNYARLELDLPPAGPVVFFGRNAQGKTSLLEALFYLITAQSPYTHHDRQLIHWRMEGEAMPYARAAVEFDHETRGRQRLEVTLLLEMTTDGRQRLRRQLKLNGVEKRIIDIVGWLQVVLFLPQDMALVEGPPQERRRFMDTTLAQVDATYLAARSDFERLLPQRNALLRQLAETGGNVSQLAYWDEQIARAGSVLVMGRQRLLRELEREAARIHAELSGGEEVLQLRYLPSFAPEQAAPPVATMALPGLDLQSELAEEDVVADYLCCLEAEQAVSIQRGATLSGPHRDELRLLINGRDCGDYGSRGQVRSSVLALKLAELSWIQAQSGQMPLLLLDEVAAELDEHRRSYLLAKLAATQNAAEQPPLQALMTTADLSVLDEAFLDRAQIWEVRNGMVERLDSSAERLDH